MPCVVSVITRMTRGRTRAKEVTTGARCYRREDRVRAWALPLISGLGNVGSETSGSILSPSNQNMLAAVKPTIGRISRYGVIPITADQDTAGPMAKTVTDVAIMLGALESPVPGSERCRHQQMHAAAGPRLHQVSEDRQPERRAHRHSTSVLLRSNVTPPGEPQSAAPAPGGRGGGAAVALAAG